jgi:ATP-dependent protease ClpP protease subunit
MVRTATFLGIVMMAWPALGLADTLILKDGRTMEGKLLSRDGGKVVFEVRRGTSSMRMNFDADLVESIKPGELPPPVAAPSSAAPSASPAAAPEPVAPPVKTYATQTYYRIPLSGVVGRTMTAAYLSRAFEDARTRKPTVVILEIDSPGGAVAEVEKLMRVITDAKKDLRIVAFVRQAISAAAITALAVDEIYVSKGSVFGAATAYHTTPDGGTADVSEKMKSIWMTLARSSAELGGHPTLLADAMIDRSFPVYCTDVGGKKTYARTQIAGATLFKPAGKLLTLTANEAINCGLAAGLASDYAELAALLKVERWTECEGLAAALAEWRAQRISDAEKQVMQIGQRMEAQFAIAVSNDPASFRDYVVFAETRRFTPDSRRKWAERAGRCSVALQRIEKEFTELEKLQKEFPELDMEESTLAMQKERIKAIKTVVQSGPPN